MGPVTGAGKTTLLGYACQPRARPSEGQALYGGSDVASRIPTPPPKAAIGFVSHASFLYGELTSAKIWNLRGSLIRAVVNLRQRLDTVIDLFRLRERIRTPVSELSAGISSVFPWRARVLA